MRNILNFQPKSVEYFVLPIYAKLVLGLHTAFRRLGGASIEIQCFQMLLYVTKSAFAQKSQKLALKSKVNKH